MTFSHSYKILHSFRPKLFNLKVLYKAYAKICQEATNLELFYRSVGFCLSSNLLQKFANLVVFGIGKCHINYR